MKQQLLSLFFLVAFYSSSAQVGIGTTNPKSSLDVIGNPSDVTSLDGIAPPRLTGNQLQAKTYTAAQNGTMIYVTLPTTTPTGQTTDVIAEGMYAFSSSQNKWLALKASPAADTTGWSLTGNAGTNATTNFLGTTDNQPLNFRVNDDPVGSIKTNNSLQLGLSATASGARATTVGFESTATADDAAAYGRAAAASGSRSTASGYQSRAQADESAAYGSGATASSARSTAIGFETTATADDATALGRNADASAARATATGYNALASNTDANAFGSGAIASSASSLALGTNASARGNSSAAIGLNAIARNQSSLAFGVGADANGNNSVSIGVGALTSAQNAAALGSNATASNSSALAFGQNSTSSGLRSSALGTGTQATAQNATAIGNGARATGDAATAVGSGTTANQSNSTALGSQANASAINTTSLGYNSDATADNATAVGYETKATGISSVAIGDRAEGNALNTIAIGYSSAALATNALAIGDDAYSNKAFGLAIGYSADAQGDYSVAIGPDSYTNQLNATALGRQSDAQGQNSIALGYDTYTNQDGAVAIGNNAESTGLDAIALGTGSRAPQDNSIILGNHTNANVRVGIGTNTPSAKLQINGSLRYVDGNQTAGRVLTSDATGNASWQAAAGDGNIYSNDGTLTAQRTINLNGNVLRFDNGINRFMEIIGGDVSDNDDPFKFTTLNAFRFDVDGNTALEIESNRDIVLPLYGSGARTGTPTYNLAVDATGRIIETPMKLATPSGMQFYSYDIASSTSPDLNNLERNTLVTKAGVYNGALSLPASGSSVLNPTTDGEGFVIKIVGTYLVRNTGNFTFSQRSDDGARIYIDGSLILNDWADSGSNTTTSNPVQLAQGKHKFEFWYYEDAGDQEFSFSWETNPDGNSGVIQANQFTIE